MERGWDGDPVVVLTTEESGSAWCLGLRRRGHPVTLCATCDEAVRTSHRLGRAPIVVGEGFHPTPVADAVAAIRSADPSLRVAAVAEAPDSSADAVVAAGDGPDMLSARLRSLAQGRTPNGIERYGSLELDVRARTARLAGAPLSLRPREFGVLLQLVHARGRVVPFAELHEVHWPGHEDGSAALRSCMYRLRKAFAGPSPVDLDVETVRGRGYRLRLGGG